MSRPAKLTPMLEQYFEIKRQVPDAILFYRLGDFYEMFYEDAQRAAPLLDLVLTARHKGQEHETPMCGVPHHAVDTYVARLIRHGLRVAICEQVEDPAAAKGLVRRDIVRIVTPGTVTESSILDRQSCYLAAVGPAGRLVAAAYLDVSTGDFFVKSYEASEAERQLLDDLARIAPREMIAPVDATVPLPDGGIPVTRVEGSLFDAGSGLDALTRHFGTQSLRGFGLDDGDARIGAAAAAMRYAASSHRRPLDHVRSLRIEDDSAALRLDAATLENLEILDSRDATRPRASLWNVVNATRSAMGARTLRRWITRPLDEPAAIRDRHDAVHELTRDRSTLDAVTAHISAIADLERLVSRVTLRSASPRELLTLAASMREVGALTKSLSRVQGPLLGQLRNDLVPPAASAQDGDATAESLDSVIATIESSIADDAPASVREGGALREGIDAELDELRGIARDSKTYLLEMERRERERTGIGSLKIRYNSVFGYSIEISKANLAKVPDDYIRKQTLVGAERFITPDLKVLEEKIAGAEQRSLAIELRLYEATLSRLARSSATILASAAAIGSIDVLGSFATVAVRNRYVRAELSERSEIVIVDGRHPVIEQLTAERFIPNSTDIDRDRNGIQVITGPNMGGKSTYLRQVALIVLLNQCGSFVPAASARLGVFDRIFTRVGASDQLARGESTFMVEMHETANILHNATDRSLIILDEVGRGTSTFDGLSLAWAIIEYLHDHRERGGITLFATHYHEVTDLAKTRSRVANANVAVKEWNDQIIFLRKIVPGPADKSYGIQVARLAGIPASIIDRAREILGTLERKERAMVEETSARAPARSQMSLFDSREEEVLGAIRSLDVDALTPIQALNELAKLRDRLRGE